MTASLSSISTVFFTPGRLRASLWLLLGAGLAGIASARAEPASPPDFATEPAGLATVTRAAAARLLAADETWDARTPRHQVLEADNGTRTITLEAIGSGGIPAGTRFVARVTTRPGQRLLFRQADGELLAFLGSNPDQPTQWVVLTATGSGWETRVSAGRFASHEEPAIARLGADLQPCGDFVQPASARTNGYALRFVTDASVFYLSCRADHPRFRVFADGVPVAAVDVDDHSGLTIDVPIELGAPRRRRVEILADALQFRGIEFPDVRSGLFAWSGAVPPVRMLWIGDGSAETGTHAYPWVAARQLGYEVWSRSWGHHAQHVVRSDRSAVPAAAIEEDVAAVDPDVIVISGHFFEPELTPRQYARVVGAWFDAIEAAARPEAVKIALSSWVNRGPVDRMTDRRAGIIAKEARRRGFQFVNWQDWIEGNPEDPSWGTAHEIIAGNYVHFTEKGNAYIGSRFAASFRELGVDRPARVAALRRMQADSPVGRLAAADAR